jgi:hypothetical protein
MDKDGNQRKSGEMKSREFQSNSHEAPTILREAAYIISTAAAAATRLHKNLDT